MAKPYESYRQADVATADQGKLILMVYDHCLKWIRKAEEELLTGKVERMAQAVQRAQRGLTELMCTLNMEKGGEIARNLFRLYDFYSRHLTTAIRQKSKTNLQDVMQMMTRLREAWVVAIENVRKDNQALLASTVQAQLSLVR
jgi:flagellar secretion chaperone FliS